MAENAKPKPKPDDSEQSKRFKETARQLETDETGKSFQRAIKAVVPPKQTGKKASQDSGR